MNPANNQIHFFWQSVTIPADAHQCTRRHECLQPPLKDFALFPGYPKGLLKLANRRRMINSPADTREQFVGSRHISTVTGKNSNKPKPPSKAPPCRRAPTRNALAFDSTSTEKPDSQSVSGRYADPTTLTRG